MTHCLAVLGVYGHLLRSVRDKGGTGQRRKSTLKFLASSLFLMLAEVTFVQNLGLWHPNSKSEQVRLDVFDPLNSAWLPVLSNPAQARWSATLL